MKKILISSLISFSLALLSISALKYYVTMIEEPKLKVLSHVTVSNNISPVINIADKVIKKKVVRNTDYLNSWKLSATVLGTKPFAMVIKGTQSKVITLKDTLEGYSVKGIYKEKVLFESRNDTTWLYIKSAFANIPKTVTRVMPVQGSFAIRSAAFKRNILKPEQLLRTINILPEMKNGLFQGLHVQYLLEGSFLYMHGLRQDDIIKKINGKKLSSIADGISAYQNITNSKRFSISVLRDNIIKELKYEIVK